MAQPNGTETITRSNDLRSATRVVGLIQATAMFYVYLIKSQKFPEQRYVGFTENLKQRLHEHNSGSSPHTKKFAPWKLITYVAFSDKHAALAFEAYLKKSSGHAFANKRLWTE
ncbi:MAG: GIY-YIG nuclease family protein [Muribaculaceae bacterium]|nr:GIY-YIG nuclease family protein [Muribaculaceae bacterium]